VGTQVKSGLKGISLKPWNFAVEPEAQSLFLLGIRTKIMILAKWSPRIQLWSPVPPVLLSWNPGALHFLSQSPGALWDPGKSSERVISLLFWFLPHFYEHFFWFNGNMEKSWMIEILELSNLAVRRTVFLIWQLWVFCRLASSLTYLLRVNYIVHRSTYYKMWEIII